MKHFLKTSLMGGCFALAMSPAMATETIDVTLIDGYPSRAMWVAELTNFFIPEIDKRLAETGNYEINWQESYGGSIVKVKGVLDGIKLGLGDIGVVTTIFHSSKLPSQAISAVTPFVAPDARAVAKAVDEIAKEFPAMQKEFDAQNQVYLATGVVLDTYQVFSTDPIATTADIKGQKVAGAGMNLRYLEGIEDAAGVRGSLTQFYNMLQTGLVDKAMTWPEAAVTFNFVEVAPYMLEADLGAVNSKTITANADFWEDLPQEVKDVILEVSVLYRDHVAGIAMERATESKAAFVEAGGTIVEIAAEDRLSWAEAMPNVAQEWAAGLDGDDKQGTDMLKAYLGKLSTSGYDGIRDWSQD